MLSIKLEGLLKSAGTIVLVSVVSGLTGCTKTVGPNMIAASHGNYNHVISDIQQEELLLNIIRRRYLEPLQFTSIGGISQSQSVVKSAGGVLNLATPTTGSLSGTGSIEDIPTYSFTPQSGPEASKALHNQIPLEVIPQMASAGYPVDLIFLLLAKEVSGLRNVDVCPGGAFVGGSEEYMDMLCAIQELESEDKVAISNAFWEQKLFEHPFAPEVFTPTEIASQQGENHSFTTTDEGQSFYVTARTPQPVLWLAPDVRREQQGIELLRMLKLDPNESKKGWVIKNQEFIQGVSIDDLGEGKRDYVTVLTRSIYGVINMLSQGVQVPESDRHAVAYGLGKYSEAVTSGKAPDIASKFVVHFSEKCPERAYLAVRHRCGFFYIEECDHCSKTYFNALFDLYNLAGPERIVGNSGVTPVLSIR